MNDPSPAAPGTGGDEAGSHLAALVAKVGELGLETTDFAKGEQILAIGQPNEVLHVILEGCAGLFKPNAAGTRVEVDRLSKGSFLGLLSFWTGEPSFTESVAMEALRCIRIPAAAFQSLVEQDRDFARQMQHLFMSNLTDRYRRLVHLNLTVDQLTHDLQHERNDLKAAIHELETTRSRLVHQEKLATMGQLLAGIAHEINNPASSLVKSVDSLGELLPGLLAGSRSAAAAKLFASGQHSKFLDSAAGRQRMQDLERRFGGLRRSLVRRIAQLDDSAMQSVEPLLGSKTWTADKETALQELLQSYEAGVHLRSADAATDRIIRLVRSLKNYGRHDPSQHEQVDLRDCIHDTLMVLNHRLKHFELTVRAKEVPLFWCHPGEINQVLTNLLVNACDATPQGGLIQLTCFTADNGDICVEVSDAGHGIDAALIDRIFEPNFTTKHRSGDFGLGLGLAISRDIARKYGGSLEAQSEPGKGARFVLRLPQGSRLPHNGAASA